MREEKQPSNGEISVFDSLPAAASECLAVNIKKLSLAFPAMGNEFFNLLSEYIIKESFSAERIEYATDRLIRQHRYKTFSIADFLSIDRTVKFYTYEEVCVLVTTGKDAFANFSVVERDGVFLRVKKVDKIKFGIPDKL